VILFGVLFLGFLGGMGRLRGVFFVSCVQGASCHALCFGTVFVGSKGGGGGGGGGRGPPCSFI